jgi:hypothetical protein
MSTVYDGTVTGQVTPANHTYNSTYDVHFWVWIQQLLKTGTTMERDMDLVRQILIELEQHQEPMHPINIKAEGYSPEQIAYHVKILAQADYIEALDMSSFSGMDWRAKLTWNGHEFLATTRNPGVWNKVKAELKDRGSSLPFSLIQQLALKIAAAHFGLTGK